MTSKPPNPLRQVERTTSREGLDSVLVRKVVDDFYEKARADDVIGPIFNRLIAEPDWPHHLDKIEAFWSSMLLGSGSYSGRPMTKHVAIHDLDDRHFERWLGLFKEAVDGLCPPGVAALFVERAERVAHSLRLGLAQHRGRDSIRIQVMRAAVPRKA
jgi:hemoglobin